MLCRWIPCLKLLYIYCAGLPVPTTEGTAAAAAAAAHPALPAAVESCLSSKESDRLSAVMRAEKAEAAATAAQNELLDVTKRCVQHSMQHGTNALCL
jgi:hypothetical protein